MSIVDDFENLIENRVRSLVVSPCLAKIIKVDGNLCDCEGIDIDDPESRAIYPLLEIPTLLGTKGGGIGGKPAVGSIVLLNFLNGDRNHPVISALIKGENSGNFTSLPKDKIKISSNGRDLGEILVKFCDMISQLQTTGSMGPSTMNPSQIFEWKLFVDKEIKGMFAVGSSGSDNDNDNGENEEQDSLSEATKQAYLDVSFNDKELTELDTSGKYELQSYDLLAIEEDYLLFWERVIPITGLSESEFHSIRDAVDLKKDEVKNKKIGDRIFVPSKKGLDFIIWEYSTIYNPTQNIGNDGQNKAKIIVLYANYLGANIKKIVCTATTRTVDQQANIVTDKIFIYPNGGNYKAVRTMVKDMYSKFTKKEISEKEYKSYIREKAKKHIEQYTSGYRHVSGQYKYVFDIGPNGSGMSSTDITFMNQSMIHIQKTNFIHSGSMFYKETQDEDAFHFVIS